jgi:hypothetical protein
MLQEPFRNATCASIFRFAPSLDPWPDFVNQWQFNKDAWIIEGAGLFRSANIPGLPAFRLACE